MEPLIWRVLKSKFFLGVLIALLTLSGISMEIVHYVDSISKTITLNDDGQEVEIVTTDETVGDLLEKYGITLGPGDHINLGVEEELADGTFIKITRSFPFYVAADGKEKMVYLTKGARVADVLKNAGVVLREKDTINYGLEINAIPGKKIVVTRYDEEILIEKEPIAYSVIVKKNHNMDEGVQKVVQEGKQGELQRKILIAYRDGEEISREKIEEKVAVEPVNRVVHKGTVKKITASRGETVRYSAVKTFQASAYTYTGNRTKTGRTPKMGYIAVDPRVIPLYSTVYVQFPKGWGHLNGYYKAMDTGGAIKGNKIDVFMETKGACLKFGRRNVKIYFIK